MEYHQFDERVKQKKLVELAHEKKRVLIRNFANFTNCEFLKILKVFFFIVSRSYPDEIKLGIEYQQYNDSVKQKVFVV